MKLTDMIKTLFGRQPATDEQLAARAEVEAIREQTRQDTAATVSAIDKNFPA
jgi:hypothetical protein